MEQQKPATTAFTGYQKFAIFIRGVPEFRITDPQFLAPGIKLFVSEAPRDARKQKAEQSVILSIHEKGEPIPIAIENSDPERPWTFKGEPLYVRRALRVEYTYREQNWDKTDYLIVLYQCSGGCCQAQRPRRRGMEALARGYLYETSSGASEPADPQ